MKILYIANHNSGGNDDEGAINHALTIMGHNVLCVNETYAADYVAKSENLRGLDLVLFHKWHHPASLERLRGLCARAFWYFDLVKWDDPSLERRNAQRIVWMQNTMPHVEFGFCTDGDWVRRNPSLIWLAQGADERVVGVGSPSENNDILFTGIYRGGRARASFVDFMRQRYERAFRHITSGCHREELRNAIAGTKIVMCPSAPVTDYYWSNRVYNAAGFGAFILHPYSLTLINHFRPNKEVVYYHSQTDMVNAIDYYLNTPNKRNEIAEAALKRVKKEHLYRHRLMILIGQVLQGKR